MKKLIPAFITFLFISFLAFGLPVYASQSDNVTICHVTGSQSNPYQKLTVDDDAVNGQGNSDHNRSGHQNGEDIIPPGYWDFNGRNWDSEGQAIWRNNCVVPTPSPSPSPTPTPTPSPSPSPSPEVTPSPTPTPSVSPVPSPTPASTPCGSACEPVIPAKSVPTATVCRDAVPGEVANIYVDRGTSNDGKLEVRWLNASPNEGAQHAHIVYTDTTPGDWKYALLNTPNDGTEVIGELKNNQHYWYSVALVNGCSVGNFSTAFDPVP